MTAARSLPAEKRTLLRFHGPDAVRYLNGQVSQDVRTCSTEQALPACVTDAKGRLQFYITLFKGQDDSLWIEAPYSVREELLTRLTRYLIADDVEVEDESDLWKLTHVVSSDSPPAGTMTLRSSRIAPDGYDIWTPAIEASRDGELLSGEEAEDLRIRHRIPLWGTDLTAGLLPPEAGLDKTAISYRKGCYIGQEVISRMKTAGKLNRRLAGLLVPAGTLAGDKIGIGMVTSVSPLADASSGQYPALGFVPKSHFESAEIEITGESALPGAIAKITGWA